jgi:Domain of unknown function (DUF4350)
VRRRELVLVAGFAAALVGVAFLGRAAAPAAELQDPRPSTFLWGPRGASALAETMEALGVAVERRRTPLFGLTEEVDSADGVALAIFEPLDPLSEGEDAEVEAWVRRGGHVILVGRTGVEKRLGVAVVDGSVVSDQSQPIPVVPPPGIDSLPPVSAVLGGARPAPGARARPAIRRRDTLLVATNRRVVAERIRVAGGGEALVLADVDWLANRSLRETDVGALIVPWMLAGGIRRIVVDEYHQGFGHRWAIFVATWGWLRRNPAGWVMLQLAAAGLLALAVAAVRFGPALQRIERRRRSPLEHLDALAAGLERAGGGQTAVDLLARGLRRRLRRGGLEPTVRGRDQWFAALANASGDPATRAAVKRLGWLVRESSSGEEHVLRTAQAVEDVWEALRQPSAHAQS